MTHQPSSSGQPATGGRPLDGVTVLSLEQAVAAPLATRHLADLGARVIKVERPGTGDFARHYDRTVHGEATYFVWLNRSKESLTLDVKTGDGARALSRLLERADVFVQNLAPGAAARLGLDAPTLTARHPRLVCCDVSGYGNDGPWADRKAYDALVQAETGLMNVTGTPDDPAKVGVSVADVAAGMYAYSGILASLYTRATTGAAPPVEVALFESLAEWMSQPLLHTRHGGTPPARVGAEHATIAPYGPFTCADDTAVLLAVQNKREWEAFCATVLDQPGLATDPRFGDNTARVAHRDELNALIRARFTRLTADEATALLDTAAIANARMNQVAALDEHPSLAGRDRWRDVAVPGGQTSALLPPATLGGTTARMDPVPALGEHTGPVLREAGYDDAAIARLRADGTV